MYSPYTHFNCTYILKYKLDITRRLCIVPIHPDLIGSCPNCLRTCQGSWDT